MQNDLLSVIFWNVWYWSQDGKFDSGQALCRRLGELIDEYDVSAFGLNEVAWEPNGWCPVVEYLTRRGYHCHFAPFSTLEDNWEVGNLLATKQPPLEVKEHLLGPDTQAERRGYPGQTVKAIEGKLSHGEREYTVWVNYFSSLIPRDWRTHLTHRRQYELLIQEIADPNLIIGGDFNETKYMLPWLRLPAHLTARTGTFSNPTWRWDGKRRRLLRANYDHLVFRNDGQLQLKTFEVLDRHPSDHAPLLAQFLFSR
jgi:endonuclease/exonuclease/phosphatase family metal-dependent hydrolase